MHGRREGQLERRTEGGMKRWMDEGMKGWWIGGWMIGRLLLLLILLLLLLLSPSSLLLSSLFIMNRLRHKPLSHLMNVRSLVSVQTLLLNCVSYKNIVPYPKEELLFGVFPRINFDCFCTCWITRWQFFEEPCWFRRSSFVVGKYMKSLLIWNQTEAPILIQQPLFTKQC